MTSKKARSPQRDVNAHEPKHASNTDAVDAEINLVCEIENIEEKLIEATICYCVYM